MTRRGRAAGPTTKDQIEVAENEGMPCLPEPSEPTGTLRAKDRRAEAVARVGTPSVLGDPRHLKLPSALLRSANRELDRLSAIDLRYERLTDELGHRHAGDATQRARRLRIRQVRERSNDEAGYTTAHQDMSDFILQDLTSTTVEAPPAAGSSQPAGEDGVPDTSKPKPEVMAGRRRRGR